jgi:hypothetical protein
MKLPSFLFYIPFNIILPSTTSTAKWAPPQRLFLFSVSHSSVFILHSHKPCATFRNKLIYFYRRCISFRVNYKSGGSPSVDSPLALIVCIATNAHIWSPPSPPTTERRSTPSWLLRSALCPSTEAVTNWYSGLSVSRLSGLTSVFKTNIDKRN